ncbi:hypothetical protein N2152v2_008631 [Parachlorella kessleri]
MSPNPASAGDTSSGLAGAEASVGRFARQQFQLNRLILTFWTLPLAASELVQYARQVAQQHGKTHHLPQGKMEARVLLLLDAGLTQQHVRAVICQAKGMPSFHAEAAASLQVLAGHGLSPVQLANMLCWCPDLLSSKQIGAVGQLLQQELKATGHQLTKVLYRGPILLTMREETVRDRLAFWAKLHLLQMTLGCSDEYMARALPRVMPLLQFGALQPRVEWLLKALTGSAPDKRLRKAMLNHTPVVYGTVELLGARLQALSQLMGSSAVARAMVARILSLLSYSSSALQHNFHAFRSLAGSEAAARDAVNATPRLLLKDFSRPVYQARLGFWQGQLGLSAAAVLTKLGTLLLSSLPVVGPRWAWMLEHRPRDEIIVNYCIMRDSACMKACKVPLEGFAEFKAAWLASEEGRTVCRHEGKYNHSWRLTR